LIEDPSLTGVIGIIVLVSCYFLPSFVALVRDKRGAGNVALVNFFLGWTVIGWLLAFVWASSGKTRSEQKEMMSMLGTRR
jgi:T4 superinfection immunity protein